MFASSNNQKSHPPPQMAGRLKQPTKHPCPNSVHHEHRELARSTTLNSDMGRRDLGYNLENHAVVPAIRINCGNTRSRVAPRGRHAKVTLVSSRPHSDLTRERLTQPVLPRFIQMLGVNNFTPLLAKSAAFMTRCLCLVR